MPNAEIIAIGTELLLGETLDTNTRFIAQTLRALGIDLLNTQTVGDNAARIVDAVHMALARADIVITTGGLGPTVDDPTRQAIADAIEVPLEYHPELWEQISARILRYGRIPTENQKRQAYVPKYSLVIENPVGTAPSFIVEIIDWISKDEPGHSRSHKPALSGEQVENGKGKVLVALPGVPKEMETLLTGSVVPYLKSYFDLKFVLEIRTLHVSGTGEAMVDEQIGHLELLSNPTVGLAAHSGIVDIRITARGANREETSQMIARVEKEIITRLGDSIFGSDEATLESSVLKAMVRRGWNLACLEVNLEGMLLTRLIRTGSPVYLGGSSSLAKSEALVAESESIRRQFNATTVLAISYSQENENQEINLVLMTPSGMSGRHLTYGGHPANARRWAVNMGLDFLLRTAQESVS